MKRVIDLVLVVLALLLALNLLIPLNNITGQITYAIDSTDPICMYSYQGDQKQIPLDRCCRAVQSQLVCEYIQTGLKCYTSQSSGTQYVLNQKAASYCQKEGYIE